MPEGPYLVLGLGRAGRAAVEALAARFGVASVRAWDDSPADRLRRIRATLAAAGVAIDDDPSVALAAVRTVIKTGIELGHPPLAEAAERALEIMDEFELGWRLSSAPTA